MSKSNTRSFITRLFVFVVSLALVGADLFVSSAQNANSSMTPQNDNMSMQNTNMSGGSRRRAGRRRRRGRRRTSSGMGMSNANAACGPENTNMAGGMQENANTGEATTTPTMGGGRRRRRGRRRSNNMAMPAGQTSTDLQNAEQERTVGKQDDFTGMSYSGTINYPEGNLTGPAKLEFMADNQFSLTPEGGQAMTGRYAAVTTRGYTGVTMMFGAASGSTTPATIISVRLKKVGNGVQIMNVPGEKREFSFTSTGMGGGGGGRRGRRGKRRGTRVAIKPPTVANGNAN